MRRVPALLAFALFGCVTGAERRPTTSESAAGAPPRDATPSAGQVLAEAPVTPSDEPTNEPPGGGWVWVRGYWHWDGVRYVWQPGRWERAQPSWVRPPR